MSNSTALNEHGFLYEYPSDTHTLICRLKNPDLPSNWICHLIECLPAPRDGQESWKATHVRLVGSLARPTKRGKNKGWPKWDVKPSQEQEFILGIEEYRQLSEQVTGGTE